MALRRSLWRLKVKAVQALIGLSGRALRLALLAAFVDRNIIAPDPSMQCGLSPVIPGHARSA
jgi:hypothetical protein